MRINIKPSNCEFYVNKEKGKVVCVLEEGVHSALLDWFCDEKFDFRLPFPDDLWLPQRFIGIATCAPEDEWNEEIGRKLAFNRAKEKFYKAFFKTASNWTNKIDNHMETIVNHLNEFGFKISENLDKQQKYIESMMK